MEYFVLQNTRLGLVHKMAVTIARSLRGATANTGGGGKGRGGLGISLDIYLCILILALTPRPFLEVL